MTYHINILIHVSLCTSMRVSVIHKCWNGSDSAISSTLLCCAVLHLLTQSCLILCNPMDCSPPDSSVHGILQARILEWVTYPFSRGSFQPRNQTGVSCLAGRFLWQISFKGGCDTFWKFLLLHLVAKIIFNDPTGLKFYINSPCDHVNMNILAIWILIFELIVHFFCLFLY